MLGYIKGADRPLKFIIMMAVARSRLLTTHFWKKENSCGNLPNRIY